jgi:DNA repair protein RecO (recombination protein O)
VLVATDAVVLHAFPYLESSRILRLATRDVGVVSVLARGARRPKSRFGSALDLFTGGAAQLTIKPGRDLHTLTGWEPIRVRHQLGDALERFTAASALAELALRFAGEVPGPDAYESLVRALDAVALAPPSTAAAVALAGGWHLVATLGFTPTVDECAVCHGELAPDVPAPFAHGAGGVLCRRCAASSPGGRPLPPRARDALRAWTAGRGHQVPEPAEVAAHQRLLRLFLQAHLADGRPLPAFDVWEQQRWTGG